MKKHLQKIKMTAAALILGAGLNAQTTADFQNLTLAVDTFWNGATSNPTVSTSGNFTSGNAIFSNKYTNGAFGAYWESGWAYSSKTNTVTAGSGNQYSAITGKGYNNSTIYAVGQGDAKLKFNATAQGKVMSGFYVTNSTYAYLSMKTGDAFTKKFGGTTGNDADWFKLTVKKYLAGALVNDSVTFYLADFRFTDNSKDYILNTWQYVDLSQFGNADSLVFKLSSSDTGQYGMNTPAYFCMDNFISADSPVGIASVKLNSASINLFPNPAVDVLNISGVNELKSVEIINASGAVVLISSSQTNDISALAEGVYVVRITEASGQTAIKKIVKTK